MEIGEKSKVGLSPDSHNAWEPAQDAGFHIPPATAAAGTMKVNPAEPLESRGCSDSCTEPSFCTLTLSLGRCLKSSASPHDEAQSRPTSPRSRSEKSPCSAVKSCP